MNQLNRHIYCIIEGGEGEAFPVEGVAGDGSDIYSVSIGPIAAVVGKNMPESPFDMDKEEVVRKLAAHQAVLEKVMENHTVLPVKFGITARDDDEVRAILTRASDQFMEIVERIQGKIEEDVVAFWNKCVFEDILREEPEIKEARDEVSAKGKNATLAESVKVGQMLAAALVARKGSVTEDIIGTLHGCSLSMRHNRIARDDMILNTAFLIRKEDEALFDDKIHELDGRFKNRVDFRCVGPLPPYSFNTIEIVRFSYAEVDAARKMLGLGLTAELKDIKEAQLRLIPALHPDKRQSDPNAAREFEELTKACQLLSKYCVNGGCSFEKEAVETQIVVKEIGIETASN